MVLRKVEVMVLKINEDRYFKLRMNCGNGTNTKPKLMALWCLLDFTAYLGIDTMTIYGDSLTVVYCDKKLCSLQFISLAQWCRRTEDLLTSFSELYIDHIFCA